MSESRLETFCHLKRPIVNRNYSCIARIAPKVGKGRIAIVNIRSSLLTKCGMDDLALDMGSLVLRRMENDEAMPLQSVMGRVLIEFCNRSSHFDGESMALGMFEEG